jgi:hypothetical protein
MEKRKNKNYMNSPKESQPAAVYYVFSKAYAKCHCVCVIFVTS